LTNIPLSQRERGLEEPSLLDGNWWPNIAPTSPSPSGRGVRGEGKDAAGKKGEGKISILPNIFKNARIHAPSKKRDIAAQAVPLLHFFAVSMILKL